MERSTKQSQYRRQHYAGRKPFRGELRRPALRLSSAFPHSAKSFIKQGVHRVDYDLHGDDDQIQQRLSSRDNRNSTSLDGSEATTDPNSDESLFHWEEGSTLLFELMQDEPLQGGAEDLDALVDSLWTPFNEQGKLLKKEIAETLVSTNNHIKSVFGALKKNVDGPFYQGLSAFDQACKNIECCAAEQQACFWDTYENTQCSQQEDITKAFEELEKKYVDRDRLWDKLFEEVDAIVLPAIERIKGAPARVEDTILKIEKRAKGLENDSRGMSSFKKGIQDLLRDT